MKFIFVSNYINHHQIPFCNAMYEMLGDGFAFMQTIPMEEERVRMGWNQDVTCPYLIKSYENPVEARRLVEECEVVMFGGCEDESFIAKRLQENRPVIRCSERLYREGQWKAISPRGLRKKYLDHTRYRNRDIYLLCNGAYVPSDFHIVRAYPDKMLRWGYFPETRHYDLGRLMKNKKPGSVLWAARFMQLKHPELPIEVAKRLRDQGIFFHMDLIGGGDMEEWVRKLIKDYGLEEQVSLKGFLAPDEVRAAMEETQIFLATSDRGEGWGAVLNEAMNSGCAVVGSHMMGGVPFLIRHRQNGMVFRDRDVDMLAREVSELLGDTALCERLGREAYGTITEEWNAETAAKRLVVFCLQKSFLKLTDLKDAAQWEKDVSPGKLVLPGKGPCSKAPVIPERRMFGMITGGNA